MWSVCANGQWFRPAVVKIPHFSKLWGMCTHPAGPLPTCSLHGTYLLEVVFTCSPLAPRTGVMCGILWPGHMSPCLLLRKMGLVGPKHQAPIL